MYMIHVVHKFSILLDFAGLIVKNRGRFWSMPLPALTRVALEGTGEVTMEVAMGGSHTVVGTVVFLPRRTASCPAMESSVRRTVLCLNSKY